MATAILIALVAIVSVLYIKALCYNLKCLRACNAEKPVEQRFSLMRRKEWFVATPAGYLVALFILYLLVRLISYIQVHSFHAIIYVNYNYNFNGYLILVATLLSYQTFYIFRTLAIKYKLKDDYPRYCVSYDIRAMNGGNSLLPDNPRRFHKELYQVNRALVGFCIAGAISAIIIGGLGLNEYAYFGINGFHYSEFCSLKDKFYYPDEFKKIYLVDSYITFTGCEDDRDYYAFEFYDGNQISFRNYATLSPELVNYTLEITGLRITPIRVLRDLD
jgi:hypothetical protein